MKLKCKVFLPDIRRVTTSHDGEQR